MSRPSDAIVRAQMTRLFGKSGAARGTPPCDVEWAYFGAACALAWILGDPLMGDNTGLSDNLVRDIRELVAAQYGPSCEKE